MKTVTTTLVALTAMMLTLPGCQAPISHVTWEMGGMPSHDHPYQTWWQYQFVYHPHAQVYFEPFTGTYFWFEGDRWEEGVVYPEWMELDSSLAQIVKLQQPKPYVQHQTVMKWSWPYSNPLAGSVDQFHATPEAIAASEHRSAMRIGEGDREAMHGGDDAWEPISGSVDLMEPMSDATDDAVDPFFGVDASSEMNEMSEATEMTETERMLQAMEQAKQQTADALVELDSLAEAQDVETPEDSEQDEAFFTVVDPMAEGDPD